MSNETPIPARDDESVEKLLARHLPEVEAYIRLRFGGLIAQRETPEDLAQSVCREILQHADRFRHREADSFRRWLFTEAQRKLTERETFLRREKRDIRREVDVAAKEADASSPGDAVAAVYATSLTPSRRAMAREEVAKLEAAFRSLPEDYRDVIALSRIGGLSHAEIAARLGRTEGAVRKTLVRALSTLSKVMT